MQIYFPQDSKELFQYFMSSSLWFINSKSDFDISISDILHSFFLIFLYAKICDSYSVSDVKLGDIVGFDDYFVYDAEDHCIPLVFITCTTCLAHGLPCIGWLEMPCLYFDLWF